MGRPKKEFDWELFDKLCSYPPVITQEDIADALKVSVDTCSRQIRKKYDCTFAQYRVKRMGSMRRALFSWQLKSAEKGNVTMQIWLGKQYLNQKEPKVEQEVVINDENDKLKVYAEKLKEMATDDAGSKQSKSDSKN